MLLYILLSALWIAYTDQVVIFLFQDPALITQVQTYKGWFFVLVSGFFVFWILRTTDLEIKKNRDFYKTMLDDAKVGLARVVDGKIISANPAFLNILEIKTPGIKEKPFLNLIDQNNREQIKQKLDKLKLDEQDEQEMRLWFGSNRKKWIQFIFSRHRDINGEYFQLIVQDINSRKTYESYNELLLQLILSLEPGMDFESSLYRMLENLCSELNWEYGIALTPGADGEFRKVVSWYKLDPLLDEFDSRVDLYHFSEGEGLTGMTAKYRKAIWIEDVEKAEYYKYKKDTLEADLRTIIAIPVVSNSNEVLAVIVLFNRLILEEDQELVKLLTAIGQDIASKLEKRREQDEHQRLEESLNFALKAANMATWDMDLKSGRILRSLNHHELFGFSAAPENWDVDDLLERVISKDRKKVHDSLMNAARGHDEYNVEYRMKLNGKIKWFWSRGNLQVDEFGEPERLTGVISDVTNKKKIEKELERERELLESLYRTIPVMITIYRPDLSEFRANKEFERVTGWSSEEAAEIDLMKAIYPDPSYRKMVTEFMSNPGSGWKDIEMEIRSGDKIHSTWTNLRLSDDTQIGIGLDITERKNYEMEIRDKERLLSEAQRVASLGTFTVDLRTGCATASVELRRIFGYNPYEPISKADWQNSLHPEHEEEIMQYLERIVREKESFDKEYVIRRKSDGEERWVDGKGEIIFNEEGEAIKMLGTIQDIDDRKRIEQKLKENEERLRLTTHSARVGLWEWNPQTGETIFDEIWANLVGYTLEELEPVSIETWNRLVHPEDLEKFREEAERYFRGDTDSYECEVRMKHKDGHWVWILDRGKVVQWDDKSEPVRMVGTHIDITDKKEQEKLLNEQKLKLQRAQQIADLGYWEYELNTGKLTWSDMVYEIFGLDKQKFELTAENFHAMVHPDDIDELQATTQVIINIGSSELTYRFIKENGEIVYVQERGELEIRPDGSKVATGTILDITEQRKAEDRIIGSIIEGSENERRRIAKELHDGFGQYLAAASMNLESTYDEIKEISGRPFEQYKKGLKLLDDAIAESRRMSQNLLPKAIEDFGLSLAIESLLDDLNESTAFEITYSDNIAEMSLPENIELNMYRIIQEGVNNAIRHSNCNRLSIQLTADGNSLSCTIEDNGSGFEAGEEKVRGLGLQNIRNRVKSMAGELEISSRLGKGTLISVIVPLKHL